MRQIVFGLILISTHVVIASPSKAGGDASCERILAVHGRLETTPLVRQTNPQQPDTSTLFPEGIFFNVTTSRGDPFIPASMQESDCYLDLAIGKHVVSAMVTGANTAIARMDARTSTLDKVDVMLRGVDEALARLSVAPASRLSSTDIAMFIEDTYRLQPPRMETPSPMQAAIYRERIYELAPGVSYVLTHFLVHRGAKLDIDSVRRAFQNDDRYVAPPKTYTSSSCKSGIDYQWPTMSGAPSNSDDDAPSAYVHWGVCKDTNEMFAYMAGKSWRKATPEERDDVCATFREGTGVLQACNAQ